MPESSDEFYRIQKLPPYVFAVINEMRAKARAAQIDVIDLGMRRGLPRRREGLDRDPCPCPGPPPPARASAERPAVLPGWRGHERDYVSRACALVVPRGVRQRLKWPQHGGPSRGPVPSGRQQLRVEEVDELPWGRDAGEVVLGKLDTVFPLYAALRLEQRERVVSKVDEGLVGSLLKGLGGLVLPRALAHDVLKFSQRDLPHG